MSMRLNGVNGDEVVAVIYDGSFKIKAQLLTLRWANDDRLFFNEGDEAGVVGQDVEWAFGVGRRNRGGFPLPDQLFRTIQTNFNCLHELYLKFKNSFQNLTVPGVIPACEPESTVCRIKSGMTRRSRVLK